MESEGGRESAEGGWMVEEVEEEVEEEEEEEEGREGLRLNQPNQLRFD